MAAPLPMNVKNMGPLHEDRYQSFARGIVSGHVRGLTIGHRLLLAEMDSVEAALEFPSKVSVNQSVGRLVDLAYRHLAQEQRTLFEHEVPLVEPLCEVYEWQSIALERIREEFRQAELTQLAELVQALWEWIMEHMADGHDFSDFSAAPADLARQRAGSQ